MKRRTRVKIVTRKLGRERAYGLQEPGLLQIDSRLTGKRRLTILVHESLDRKSTRLNSSHSQQSRMPSSA